MRHFEICHKFTAKWEGGYCNIKEDRGGATNYGISLKFLKYFAQANPDFMDELGIWQKQDGRRLVDVETIRNISKKQAAAIFKKEFWDGLNLDNTNPMLDIRAKLLLYDAAVNCGPRNSVRFAQRGHNAWIKDGNLLAVDGIAGPKTRAALAQCSQGKAVRIIQARREYYFRIIGNDQSQMRFITGWMNRLIALERAVEDLE